MSLSTTSPDNRRPDFLKLFTPVMTPQLVLFPSGKIFKYVILPHSTHITVSECQNVISSPDNRRPAWETEDQNVYDESGLRETRVNEFIYKESG